MIDALVTLAAGAVLGFAVGVGVGRARRGRLSFVGDFLAEEVEALHGADLDADVAAERARRMPDRQAEIGDEWAMARMVGMTDLRTAPQRGNWLDPLPAGCGWSDGDTVCGDPAAGTVDWPGQGPVPLCAGHIQWARDEVDG